MEDKLEKRVFEWAGGDLKGTLGEDKEYYCETRDVFQARLDKMVDDLLAEDKINADDAYIISAIAGEIGNNSFDHNLGSWPDIMGVFFGYEFGDGQLKIVLADRGQGLLATLKRVKPEIIDDNEALFTAFNERISGRSPELRGNGLKFVKENIKARKMRLIFISGQARAELNDEMTIAEIDDSIRGSLAVIAHQYAR